MKTKKKLRIKKYTKLKKNLKTNLQNSIDNKSTHDSTDSENSLPYFVLLHPVRHWQWFGHWPIQQQIIKI